MRKKTAEEVERLLKGYKESGLSRQDYCRREGMPVTTLDYYRQRSTRKAAAARRAAASGLVKVKLKGAAVDPQRTFTLVLVNGRRIESGWSFGDAEMVRLIRIVEAA
jgi:hypothetical protein